MEAEAQRVVHVAMADDSAAGKDYRELVSLVVRHPEHRVPMRLLPLNSLFTDLAQSAAIMNQHRLLMFHYPSGTYRFCSRAVQRAAVEQVSAVLNTPAPMLAVAEEVTVTGDTIGAIIDG